MSGYRMLVLSMIIAVAGGGAAVSALNTPTHRIVNRQAALASFHFDQYLRNSLGFRSGLPTVLRGRNGESFSIQGWVAEGGVREDDVLRFLRHFHDPLKPWDSAGLDLVIDRHDSSVRWMQEPHQGDLDTGGFWSWRDARRIYYQALVEPNATVREALWADMFRSLGQIMHLVVDASVPEHTRNDMHPLGGFTASSSYEYWVSAQHASAPLEDLFVAKFLSAPIGFMPDILRLPPPAGEHIALAPIARLIDADRYDGRNPWSTVAADPRLPVPAGLAEIANANFYSENTFRAGYPSPTDEGLIRVNLDAPSGRVRRYWSRPGGLGLLPANPLRAECASEAYGTETPPPYPCMDGVVWNQVAAHMLPRAVGYASGVLDYFFRGSMSVTGVEWTSSGITIDIRNDSEEEMEGSFEVVARHQPGSPTEHRTLLAALDGGAPVLLGPGEAWTFALPIAAGVVASAAHLLVFKGRLGLEEEAVVGQVFTVPHVEVRQTGYDADLAPSCARVASAGILPPYPSGVTVTLNSESMRCEWRVVNHRVSGTFETNTWLDPATGTREPVIDRIEAEWVGGDAPGAAPLTIDGRTVGSVWQREGLEPDPVSFSIADPFDRSRSYLYVLVRYVQGGEVEAQMAIFTWPVSSHGKQIVLDNRIPSARQYLVTSGRAVSGLVAYNWQIDGQMRRPLFEAVTHGGAPVPTEETTEQRFGGSRVFREGRRVNEEAYSENAIDDFEVLANVDAALARYAGIEPLVSPHPDGPVYVPAAEVRRRYQPMEREFMRAFVTADPEPYVVRLTAAAD